MLPENVVDARHGFDTVLTYLSKAATTWGIDFEPGNSTTLIDPFDENRTLVNVVKQSFSSLDAVQNMKVSDLEMTKDAQRCLLCQVWFSNKLWYSLPIETNLMYNGILRALLPQDLDPEKVGLHLINHPMNKTVKQSFDDTNTV
jgi:hypothetical protein